MTTPAKLIISLIILLISLSFPLTAIAHDETIQAQATQITPATKGADMVVQKQKEADYTLPYPGILPDNPLYVLKALRDRFIAFLISDPQKKAEFAALQADKHLASAMYLMDKGTEEKITLAEQTVSKGTNYFEQAIQKTSEAKNQAMETTGMEHRLTDAVRKHLQVVRGFVKSAKGKQKEGFRLTEKRLQQMQKDVRRLTF